MFIKKYQTVLFTFLFILFLQVFLFAQKENLKLSEWINSWYLLGPIQLEEGSSTVNHLGRFETDYLSEHGGESDLEVKEGQVEKIGSTTLTWFKHSPLLELFKKLAEQKITTFITTDHGTIPVNNPVKVVGDKNTSTNLRYKMGRNLNYNRKKVFEITEPEKAGLPSSNISSSYIFCYANDFFAYPNNFNHYVWYYKDTLQHGGISMEELIIPCITLKHKE